MGNLYQNTHAYKNIQREKCFGINFHPISNYDNLVDTIHHNELDDNEFDVGGFTFYDGKKIHAPMIRKYGMYTEEYSGFKRFRNYRHDYRTCVACLSGKGACAGI